jgi:RNA polymerase sigma factor (sigma-70 family)
MIIEKNIVRNIGITYSLPDLFEKYSQDIYRYTLSLLKDADDANDAVQDVFVKYAESESSFKGNCSQKTWLIVIARNYCFNRLKRSESKNIRIDEETFEIPYEIDLDSRIALKDALKLLSPEHNELLFLVEFENYSYKEIAEITSQSVENIKIKLFRARQRLRKILKNY